MRDDGKPSCLKFEGRAERCRCDWYVQKNKGFPEALGQVINHRAPLGQAACEARRRPADLRDARSRQDTRIRLTLGTLQSRGNSLTLSLTHSACLF